MADTVRVKPWPGLILDGIPSQGADIPKALAEEWITDRLLVRAEPVAPTSDRQKPTQDLGGARSKRQGKPSNG